MEREGRDEEETRSIQTAPSGDSSKEQWNTHTHNRDQGYTKHSSLIKCVVTSQSLEPKDEKIYASLISVHTIKPRRSWSAANLSPRALVKIEEEGKKRVKGNMQSKENIHRGKRK